MIVCDVSAPTFSVLAVTSPRLAVFDVKLSIEAVTDVRLSNEAVSADTPLDVTAKAFFLLSSPSPTPTVKIVSPLTDWLYFPTAVSLSLVAWRLWFFSMSESFPSPFSHKIWVLRA